MREQYSFAVNTGFLQSLRGHTVKSIRGFSRTFASHPWFAFKLLCYRSHYVIYRRFPERWGQLITPEGLSIKDSAEVVIYWNIFVERDLGSPRWLNELSHAIKPTIIDVGANVGFFSHWVKLLKPSAHCIAMEAHPSIYKRGLELITRTHQSIAMVNAAATNINGPVMFTLGQAVFALAQSPIHLLHADPDPETIMVNGMTLDGLVPDKDVFLIKIDVEGAEHLVLEGAKTLLKRTRHLIVECVNNAALQKVYNRLQDWDCKKISTYDYLFTNPKL